MSDAFSHLVSSYPVVFAAAFGIIPALIWLWFWLKEDIHPEPTKLIIFTYLLGMLAVLVALPLQKGVEKILSNETALFVVWALIEELLKFGAAWIGGLHTSSDDEPIDAMMYMLVAALGFTAMENTLFLIDPLISGNIGNALITGNLRFVGATLLHIMSSASLGVLLALSFGTSRSTKVSYVIIGLILAGTLHSLFNIFIIQSTQNGVFIIFGVVWVCIIALLLAFERIKRA